MATETLFPTGLVSSNNYTSPALGNFNDDPDTTTDYGTWDGNGDTSALLSFDTPTGPPTTGSGLQEFRVAWRKSATGGNAATYSIELYESGVQVAVLATGTIADSTSKEIVSVTWDAASLGTADGSNIEILVLQTGGATGAPGNRRGLELGGVEYNVDYAVSRTVTASTEALDITANAATVNRSRTVVCSPEAVTISANAAAILRVWTADADHFTVDDNTYHLADGYHTEPSAANRNVVCSTEAIAVTANAATVNRTRAVGAASEAIAVAGQAASINRQRGVGATTESVTITEQAATVNRQRGVSAATEEVSVTENAATVNRTRAVSGATEAVSTVTAQAGVNRSRNASAASAAVDVVTADATVNRSRNVGAATEAVTITTGTATIQTGVNRVVTGATEAVEISTAAATVNRARNVACSTEALSVTAAPATVTRIDVSAIVGGGPQPGKRRKPEVRKTLAQQDDELLMQFVEEYMKRAA